MTGEISIRGKVKPVGGVVSKVNAAASAGVRTVFIPRDNDQDLFRDMDIRVIPCDHMNDILNMIFDEPQAEQTAKIAAVGEPAAVISAQGEITAKGNA